MKNAPNGEWSDFDEMYIVSLTQKWCFVSDRFTYWWSLFFIISNIEGNYGLYWPEWWYNGTIFVWEEYWFDCICDSQMEECCVLELEKDGKTLEKKITSQWKIIWVEFHDTTPRQQVDMILWDRARN